MICGEQLRQQSLDHPQRAGHIHIDGVQHTASIHRTERPVWCTLGRIVDEDVHRTPPDSVDNSAHVVRPDIVDLSLHTRQRIQHGSMAGLPHNGQHQPTGVGKLTDKGLAEAPASASNHRKPLPHFCTVLFCAAHFPFRAIPPEPRLSLCPPPKPCGPLRTGNTGC
jgi:hypothetical protein